MDSASHRQLALSAPAEESDRRVQNAVVNVVAELSIVGSAWVILSFALFKKLRTFRHQLILGLSLSDFLMSLNVVVSTSMDLSGKKLYDAANQDFCSVNGFAAQLLVSQTDYWVFIIAVCTFLVLESCDDQAKWIQKHSVVLWVLVWGFSTLTASIGLAVIGYDDIGTWCWLSSDRINLYFNYIPRWTMTFIMLAIYLKLYQVISSAHMSFAKDADNGLERDVESNASKTSLAGRSKENTISGSQLSRNTLIFEGAAEVNVLENSTVVQSRPVLKKMLMYPTAYMIVWTIPTIVRIYQATTNQRAPFPLSTLEKACTAGQGLMNALVYGLNDASIYTWCNLFGWERQPPPMPLTRATNSVIVEIVRTVTFEPADKAKPNVSVCSISSGKF